MTLTDKAASFAGTETQGETTVGQELGPEMFMVSATVDIKMAMDKPTANERRQALHDLYTHATKNERYALFGVAAIFLARCEGIPPAHSPEPRS